MSRWTRLVGIIVIVALAGGLVIAGMATANGPNDANGPEPPDRANHTVPVDPVLLESDGDAYRQQQHGPDEKRVHVEILAARSAEAAAKTVRKYGTVTVARDTRLEAVIPREDLVELAEEDSIAYIQVPRYLERASTSEGVERTGADEVHLRGATGAGSTVAVIDISVDPDHAPIRDAVVETKNFKQEAMDAGSTTHGDASAEIVLDMAPDTDLVLVTAATVLEMEEAAEWVNDHPDVDVVSMSLGTTGIRLDGEAPIDRIIDDGVDRGTNWMVSAGNEGDGNHYYGEFRDGDANDVHEFDAGSGDSECNVFSPQRYQTTLTLQWDAWDATGEDYDLYLYEIQGDGSLDRVARSTRDQEWASPVEQISASVSPDRSYCTVIHNHDASGDATFNLFGSGDVDFDYSDEQRSILAPATGERSFAVGASRWDADGVQPYSSQGPTVDGRTGIDLIGPDGVSTDAYGPNGYYGTSAAAPHVAGAAALLAGQNASATAIDINDRLRATGGPVGGGTTDPTAIGHGHLEADRAAAPFPPTTTSPPPAVNDSNQANVPVTVSFDHEPIAGTAEVRLLADGETATGTASVDTGSTSTTVTVDASVLPDGDVTAESRLVDGGWANPQGFTAAAHVPKDTRPPNVTAVTVPAEPINDTDVETVQGIVLEFDEPMDTDITPAVSITGLAHSPTVSAADGWIDETTWHGAVDFEDHDEVATGTVTVTDARDAAGNEIDTATGHEVVVDTAAPSVQSLTAMSSHYNVTITLETDENLTEATVDLDGPDNHTFDVADFTAEPADGEDLYRYALTQEVTAKGSYTVRVVDAVDAAGNDGATGEQTTTEVDPPEFVVTSLDGDSEVVQGNTYTIDVTVTNDGGDPGTDTVALSFGGEADVDAASVDLAPGESENVTLEYDVPEDETPGDTGVTATTRHDTATTSVTVLEAATFLVNGVSNPASIEQGEALSVDATVENDGDVDGTTDVELRLGTDTTDPDSYEVIAVHTDFTLAPGESASPALSGTVPVDTETGKYELAVVTPDDAGTSTITVEQATGSFQGSVVAADDPDEAIAATLTLADPETGSEKRSFSADENGTFHEEEVQVGTYEVTVDAPDFEATSETVVIDRDAVTDRHFELEPEPAIVEGSVTDAETGDPLDGTVSFERDDGTVIPTTVSDGTYRIAVPRGEYQATATENADRYDPETVSGLEFAAAESATVDVTLLPKPGEVTGVVVAADTDEPIAGADVALGDRGTTADGNGSFTLADVDRGEYTLAVRAPDFEPEDVAVTVGPGETVDLEAVALNPEPAGVSGNVTNATSGAGVENATVVFEPDHGEAFRTTSAADGTYTLEVPRGSYRMTVEARGYETATAEITLDANEEATADAALEPAATYFAVTDVASDEMVTAGESITVEGTIANVGTENGTDTVHLAFDEEDVDSTTVELGPDEHTRVALEHETSTELRPDEYAVTVRTSDETTSRTVTIEAPPEEDDASGSTGTGGAGGTGGGAAPPPAPADETASDVESVDQADSRSSETVQITDAHRSDDEVRVPFETVVTDWIAFENESASGNVTVTEGVKRPTTAADPHGETVMTFTVDVPASEAAAAASMSMTVPQGDVTDPGNLTLEHYDPSSNEWTVLETDLVSRGDGEIVVVADIEGFSLFAITEYQPSRLDSVTPGRTATTTDGSQQTVTPSSETEPTPTADDGAGFGPLLAVLAVMSAVIARRRCR